MPIGGVTPNLSPAARLKPMALRTRRQSSTGAPSVSSARNCACEPGKAIGRFGLSKETAPEAGFRHNATEFRICQRLACKHHVPPGKAFALPGLHRPALTTG